MAVVDWVKEYMILVLDIIFSCPRLWRFRKGLKAPVKRGGRRNASKSMLFSNEAHKCIRTELSMIHCEKSSGVLVSTRYVCSKRYWN